MVPHAAQRRLPPLPRNERRRRGPPCGGIWTLAPCHFEDVGFPCLQGENERAAIGGIWAYAPLCHFSTAPPQRGGAVEKSLEHRRESRLQFVWQHYLCPTPARRGKAPFGSAAGPLHGRSTERPPVPFYCFFPFFLPRGPFPRRGKLSLRRSLYRPYSSRTASPSGAPAKGNRNLRRICRSLRRSFSSAFSSS